MWVGHCENASVLLGPLTATALLALGGPTAVPFGCAAITAVAAAIASVSIPVGPRPAPHVPGGRGGERGGERRAAVLGRPFAAWAEVVRRPMARGVLLVDTATYVLVGAFDIVLVVLAAEHLDLGDAGAGLLGSLFGLGAFLSSAVTGRVATRARLAPTMIVLVAATAAGCAVLAGAVEVAVACVVLPMAGFGRGVVAVLGRVLLQRSAPPEALPRLFGAQGTSSGIGLLSGSLIAQTSIAASGVRVALVVVAVVLGVILLVAHRALRAADDAADVPVVAMTLLRRLPLFAPLPTPALETVARAARECHVAAGDVVVRQGEPGDEYFAVASGSLAVELGGRPVRSIGRGEGFGEVALLADVPRTATVTAATGATLFAVEREAFLLAVTGHAAATEAAWSSIDELAFDVELHLAREASAGAFELEQHGRVVVCQPQPAADLGEERCELRAVPVPGAPMDVEIGAVGVDGPRPVGDRRHLEVQQPATRRGDRADRRAAGAVVEVLDHALADDEVVAPGRAPRRQIRSLVAVATARVLADVDALVAHRGSMDGEPVAPVPLAGADVEHRPDRDLPPCGERAHPGGEVGDPCCVVDTAAAVEPPVVRGVEPVVGKHRAQ